MPIGDFTKKKILFIVLKGRLPICWNMGVMKPFGKNPTICKPIQDQCLGFLDVKL